ncbi:polyphosphate:AMP phosphotransferase [Thiotrichales bacterium HSG1]|nr:polyphosphate:AMP phosphotransferase [Thiotrichales bacterium HSG1]
MFEAAELGREISKSDYKAQLPDLRAEILQTQFALSKSNRPVIILISGVDVAGRGDVVNALNEWLDTRGVETFSFEKTSDEESERPDYWRYWRSLPARGRIGVFFGAWYVEPIRNYAYDKIDAACMDDSLGQIRRLEKLMVDDGTIIIKFWLHLSHKEQVKRLKKMEKDPNALRRVSKRDWKHVKLYDRFSAAAERAIRSTDTGDSPWLLVESTDPYYRDLTVGRTVLETIRKQLELDAINDSDNSSDNASKELTTSTQTSNLDTTDSSPKAALTVLDHVDLNQKLEPKEYRKQLKIYQGKLNRLVWAANAKKRSTVIVFEGWDAGGKGGSLRRMTQAMDARLYQVISTAAPTDEEQAHHYLWRFWRQIPRAGHFTIYDRSWYGRVLVERVEGYAKEHEWTRSFLEINNFEESLVNHGTLLLKFWIHISPEEQLRRFEEREKIAYKRHKLTEEDWRNREKWDAYKIAVNDMVARTSTNYAPWTLVAGNDKKFARIQVIKTVCKRMEAILYS